LRFSLLTIVTVPFRALFLVTVAWVTIVCAGVYLFVSYFLYLKYVKKVRPKYPLASPGLEQEPIFPRTNISRPVYKDYREHPEYFDKKKKKQKK